MSQQAGEEQGRMPQDGLTALLSFSHPCCNDKILGNVDADPVLSIAIELSVIRIILIFVHLGFFPF